jgi:hypothetical protein
MRVAIRLRGVEEENIIRVCQQRLAAISSAKHAAPDKHDAVCEIRLLAPLGFDSSETPKVYGRYSE